MTHYIYRAATQSKKRQDIDSNSQQNKHYLSSTSLLLPRLSWVRILLLDNNHRKKWTLDGILMSHVAEILNRTVPLKLKAASWNQLFIEGLEASGSHLSLNKSKISYVLVLVGLCASTCVSLNACLSYARRSLQCRSMPRPRRPPHSPHLSDLQCCTHIKREDGEATIKGERMEGTCINFGPTRRNYGLYVIIFYKVSFSEVLCHISQDLTVLETL